MKLYDRMKKAYRQRELRRLLDQEPLSLTNVRKAAALVIERARKDEAAGIRKDRWLFEFESSIEEVMDRIQKLEQAPSDVTPIYKDLYDFAVYAMEDTYMPLYLYILYRYADILQKLTGTRETISSDADSADIHPMMTVSEQ